MKGFFIRLGIVWAILGIAWLAFAFHPPRAFITALLVGVLAVLLVVDWMTDRRKAKASKGRAD